MKRKLGNTMIFAAIVLMLIHIFAERGVVSVGLNPTNVGWTNMFLLIVGGWLIYDDQVEDHYGSNSWY